MADFQSLLDAEITAINGRRRRLCRPQIEPPPPPKDDCNSGSATQVVDATGLALSGGGIRSAAFCLGALQALDASPTSAACTQEGKTHTLTALDHVDYLSTVSGGGYIGTSMAVGMTKNGGAFPFTSTLSPKEPASLQHVRDHSNYLLAHGKLEALISLVIYLRGLSASIFLLVLPILLLLAAATIALTPLIGAVAPGPFFFATVAGAGLVALLLTWAIFSRKARPSESGSRWVKASAALLLVVAALLFLGLQQVILNTMLDPSKGTGEVLSLASVQGWLNALTAVLAPLAAVLAPLATIVAFFSGRLGEAVNAGATATTWRGRAMAVAGKAAIWVAGLTAPFLLWVAYLYLTVLAGQVESTRQWGIVAVYASIGLALLSIGVAFLKPNANSLHRLYRDRLGRAFHFKPPEGPLGPGESPEDLSAMPIDEIDTELAPYPLINAALNMHGSKFANRRGRDADFFVFTPDYIGAEATGYCAARAMAKLDPELDIAAAAAISGAAASANMGSATIRPLTPTLALLNVRLGYWLRNPRHVEGGGYLANFYMLGEILSRLDETRRQVYLTDGGHVENLGVYQLLKRRCRLIVAVDAEADAAMNFNSFVRLQMYARIDLGVRISLPWQAIRETSLDTGAEIAAKGWPAGCRDRAGPHCAIGVIEYPGGEQGTLVYVKASMSGDENDYIVDYKRRAPAFPHESTADQFFSEEQFEVYRALGFHALKGFLDRKAITATTGPDDEPRLQGALERLGLRDSPH